MLITVGWATLIAQAQAPTGRLATDSIMAINNQAFSLIFTNLDSAEQLANLGYNQALLQKDTLTTARALSVLGSVNWAKANYNLSLKLYFDALSLYEAKNDTLGVIRCYNNIAEVYKKLKYYDNALRYLSKARKKIELYTPGKESFLNILNTAQTFIALHQYDSAHFYLTKAQHFPKESTTIKWVSFMNYLLAKLAYQEGDYEKAGIYIEQSIFFAESIANSLRLCEGYILQGEVLVKQGKRLKALNYFLKADSIAQKQNYQHQKLNLYKNFYELAILVDHDTNAIEYLLEYSNLKDEIYQVSISRQAAEFETVYELEKIEQENNMLQLQQATNNKVIKYQIGFIILALIALVVATYFIVAMNKQRKSLTEALAQLEEKSKEVEQQKKELEKQSTKTEALNRELTLLNKNLESRALEIARDIEIKTQKMNKYAFMNAHKLRGPIASILGLINLFGKNLPAQDEATMIEMLKESADKLDKVVHEIKDVIDE